VIRCLLCDLGNVLVHFSHERMCRQIAELCGDDPEAIFRWLFESGLQLELECGRITVADVHVELQKAVRRPVDFDDLVRAGSDIFTLNEPMVDVLDALKQAGCRLVLLSNTSVPHIEWVRDRWDVLERFDECVLSCETGAVKPEPAIYRAAIERIECDPSECLYVDDIVEYVEAGRGYGLDGIVFTDTESLIGQLADRGIAIDS